jgi:hypothetical protein
VRPVTHVGLAALVASTFIGLLSDLVVATASPGSGGPPAPPLAPRILLDTTYVAPRGRTIAVRAGGDFQAALNAALPGDVITLEAGGVFRGNFILPRKSGSDWIVIRSSARDGVLPPPGTRVKPALAPVLAKLVTPNVVPVIQAAPGARRYRLIGLELTVAESVRTLREIVAFGGTQSRLADTPSDLILDRCYVHGHPAGNLFRGVLLNSAASAVIDSHVSEAHVVGYDSQAILGFNGPGPFKIVNNYLEGAGENIMFGGGDPSIAGLVPSDIEIRGNHLFKPLRWRRDSPDYVGIHWTVKNLLELKNAQRVLIDGNVLENVWVGEQSGASVVLTPRNGGSAPWSVVQDVMFRNNIVRNALGGVAVQSMDDNHPSKSLSRVAIANNLWIMVDRFFLSVSIHRSPVEDFLVDHNTAIPTRYFSYDLDASTFPGVIRFQFTNNLTGVGVHGVKFPRTEDTTTRWTPGATIAANVLIHLGRVTDGREGPAKDPLKLPVNMFSVVSDQRAAELSDGGTLGSASPLRQAGTDGRDIGVDFARLPGYH